MRQTGGRWRLGAAVVAVMAMMAAGLVAAGPLPQASASSTPTPTTSTPTTTSNDVTSCPTNAVCLGGGTIIDSRIPIPAADVAGVKALVANARSAYLDLHDFTSNDPRVTEWGQADIRAIMFDELLNIINTPAGTRTTTQAEAYNWFAHVVQTYEVAGAKDALSEYQNWEVEQCAFTPQVPTPTHVYYAGIGCEATGTTPSRLVDNTALPPTVSNLEAWGAYKAAQTYGKTAATATDDGDVLAAGLTTTAIVAGATAGMVRLSTSSALQVMRSIGSTSVKGAETVARRMALLSESFFGDGELAAVSLITGAIVMIVLSLVAIIIGVIDQINDALIPAQLQDALNAVDGALPNLSSMLTSTTTTGAGLLYALFLGNTQVNAALPPQGLATVEPDWHGDMLTTAPVATTRTPPVLGTPVDSKALSVESWGYAGDTATSTTVTWLTDKGWFEERSGGSTKWTTDSELRFVSWTGTKETALIDGDQFIVIGGNETASTCTGATPATTCSSTPTLDMRDADGNPVQVTLQPEQPIGATIDVHSTNYVEGEPTTFTDSNTDPLGATTYTWQFESRLPVTGLSFCVEFGGGCTSTFHTHPVATETGQTVSYTWPTKGVYHVRLTTKNSAGETAVKNITVTVAAGAAPTLDVVKSHLGPAPPGNAVTVAACFTTAPGPYAAPKVTVNWGDGTTQSQKFVTGITTTTTGNIVTDTADTGPVRVQTGGITETGGPLCTAPWSFVATHSYSAQGTYPITITVTDGEGQTVTDSSLTAVVAPSELVIDQFAATNPTTTTSGLEPAIPNGVPEYTEGATVDFTLKFNAAPSDYGDAVTLDYGDGVVTAFINTCNVDGCTMPADLQATHRYLSQPDVSGISLYTVTAIVSQAGGNTVEQYSTLVAIKDVAPTLSNVKVTPADPVLGQAVTLSGTVSSPNGTSPLTVYANWAPSGQSVTGSSTQSVTLPALVHAHSEPFSITQSGYLTLGAVDASLQVADDAGGVSSPQYAAITVADVDPIPSVPPVTGFVGTPLSLSVATGAPALSQPYSETVTWGDGSAPSVTSYPPSATGSLPSPDHTYALPGTYTLTVTLNDGHGGVGDTTTTATIADVAPAVTLTAGTGTAGSPSSLRGTITDVSDATSFTGTVNWHDGSAPESFSEPAGTTAFSLPHTYANGGVYAPSVVVTDASGTASNQATTSETITGPAAFTGITTPATLALDTTGGSGGEVGVPYSFTFAAAGFPSPTFSLASGSLPPGLALSGDGILSGTPTKTGSFTFTITADNGLGSVTSDPITVEVGSAPILKSISLPPGHSGDDYRYTFAAKGFPTPTYALASGTLPPGLSLSTAGVLSGKPTASGTFTFAISASNFVSTVTSSPVTLSVSTSPASRTPTRSRTPTPTTPTTPTTPSPSPPAAAMTRIAGTTADATAVKELETEFPATGGAGSCVGGSTASSGTRPVILATTKTYPDALSASYLAGSLDTGILLTPSTQLSAVTAGALKAEGVTKVIIVGGPLAVSAAVASGLAKLPAYACGGGSTTGADLTVTRIGGATEYDTAEMISESPINTTVGSASFTGAYTGVNTTGGSGVYNDTEGSGSAAPSTPQPLRTAILATGTTFEDAMSASAVAYAMRFPVLLTTPASLSTQAGAAIADLGIAQVIVMGGPLAISNPVVSALENLGVSVLRVAGADATDTAVELAQFEAGGSGAGLGWSGIERAAVTRGNFFTDGLAGSVLTGKAKLPLLLTENPTTVGPYLTAFLKRAGLAGAGIDSESTSKIGALDVLGGTLAITTAVVSQMAADLT